MQDSTIENICNNHNDCCITESCEENNCGLDLSDLSNLPIAMIHGSAYQSRHSFQNKLCDRIILVQRNKNFLCVVELKGGENVDIKDAIDQIQGGLSVASSLLSAQWAESIKPLLVYSGSMRKVQIKVLKEKFVSYKGKKLRVRRVDCGSKLLTYLNL